MVSFKSAQTTPSAVLLTYHMKLAAYLQFVLVQTLNPGWNPHEMFLASLIPTSSSVKLFLVFYKHSCHAFLSFCQQIEPPTDTHWPLGGGPSDARLPSVAPPSPFHLLPFTSFSSSLHHFVFHPASCLLFLLQCLNLSTVHCFCS